ncbi:MAG: L,D-transpeptidase [Solirubrobacteraceae bacterium]|nr:L,D-transpeptidase [Solirubrobacteraceae bacterium]
MAVGAPLASLAGAGGASASIHAGAVAAPSADGAVVTRLSDEATLSRWAYPAREALVRTAPSDQARVIARLRILTEDRLPETYLLLQRREGPGAGDWVRLRVPGRPNGRTGWVPRDALGSFHRVRTAVTVDRRRLRVTVRRRGRVVFRAPVGIGTPSTPTPAGRFWVREKFRVAGGGVYGPRALGTAAYAPRLTDWPSGGVVGFHGTNQPGLIPGRPSHGCIRLRNHDIRRFYRLVPVGTPVRIR